MNFLRAEGDGIQIELHVQPRASRTALAGKHGEALKIAVQAPPVDNAANEAIREFLAEFFHVPRARVTLVRGEKSRQKTFRVAGLPLALAQAKLGEALA